MQTYKYSKVVNDTNSEGNVPSIELLPKELKNI